MVVRSRYNDGVRLAYSNLISPLFSTLRLATIVSVMKTETRTATPMNSPSRSMLHTGIENLTLSVGYTADGDVDGTLHGIGFTDIFNIHAEMFSVAVLCW